MNMMDVMRGGGVIPVGPVCQGTLPRNLCAPTPIDGIEILGAWYGFANPSQQQDGPSCGGNAAAAVIESMLRRDCAQAELFRRIERKLGHLRWQIDGDRLWREARIAWANGDLTNGLTMDQIRLIPTLTGILSDHDTREVAATAEARQAALQDGPLVLGVALGQGWESPAPLTGYIDPLPPNPQAGHAVCLVAAHRQGGHGFEAIMNSWGGAWGRYGYGMVNSEYASYCQIDAGAQWRVQPGWWSRSTVWDYVIAHREAAA